MTVADIVAAPTSVAALPRLPDSVRPASRAASREAASTSRCWCRTRRRPPPRSSRPTRRRRRPSWSRRRTWHRRRPHARGGHQQRLRQRLHGRGRSGHRACDGRSAAATVAGCDPDRRARRVDRRDRRHARSRHGRERDREGVGGIEPRRRRARRARHHDDRSVPEGSGASRSRRPAGDFASAAWPRAPG